MRLVRVGDYFFDVDRLLFAIPAKPEAGKKPGSISLVFDDKSTFTVEPPVADMVRSMLATTASGSRSSGLARSSPRPRRGQILCRSWLTD
jgi:hypothetical protein